MSKCCWRYGTRRLARCRVTTELPFVKDVVSLKGNKAKCACNSFRDQGLGSPEKSLYQKCCDPHWPVCYLSTSPALTVLPVSLSIRPCGVGGGGHRSVGATGGWLPAAVPGRLRALACAGPRDPGGAGYGLSQGGRPRGLLTEKRSLLPRRARREGHRCHPFPGQNLYLLLQVSDREPLDRLSLRGPSTDASGSTGPAMGSDQAARDGLLSLVRGCHCPHWGGGQRAVLGRGCRKGVSRQEVGTAVLNSPEARGLSSRPSLRKVKVVGTEDRQSPTAVAVTGIKGNPSSA